MSIPDLLSFPDLVDAAGPLLLDCITSALILGCAVYVAKISTAIFRYYVKG